MAYKCPLCGKYKVDKKTDICVMCRLNMDEGTPIPNRSQTNKENIKSAKADKVKKTPNGVEVTKKKNNKNSTLNSNPSTVMSKRSVEYNMDDAKQERYKIAVHSPKTDSSSFTTDEAERFYSEYFVQSTNSNSRSSANAFDDYQLEKSKDREKETVHRSGFGSPTVTGIVRNVSVQQDNAGFLLRWIRGMFSSQTFTFSGQITSFQVFSENDGDTFSSNGKTADQVCVYGSVNAGYFSEHNVVEVWGSRNLSRVILARRIRNLSNDTEIRPKGRVLRIVQWFLVTLIVLGVVYAYNSIDWEGLAFSILLWALSWIIPIVIVIVVIRFLWRRFFRR